MDKFIHKAYLIVQFQTDCGQIPIITHVGIFSESVATLTGAFGNGQASAEILRVAGKNFAEAKENLENYINEMPLFNWVRPFLKDPAQMSIEARKLINFANTMEVMDR